MEKLYREENNERLKSDCKNTREFYKQINKTFAESLNEDRVKYIIENDLSAYEQIILIKFCEYLTKINNKI